MRSRHTTSRWLALSMLLAPLAVAVAGGPLLAGGAPDGVGFRLASVATKPVTDARFRFDRARLEADELGESETEGPNVVVYPEKDSIQVSGEWFEGGVERSWTGMVHVEAGERYLVRVGGEAGVVLAKVEP